MSFHAFNRAIVRTPSRSVVDGLRAVDVGAPNHEGVLREHAAYVHALEALGVGVETLPALEACPDSVFVEDTALVFTGAAILLRPGAATRRGEAAEMAATLERNFERVLRLEDGTAEGVGFAAGADWAPGNCGEDAARRAAPQVGLLDAG